MTKRKQENFIQQNHYLSFVEDHPTLWAAVFLLAVVLALMGKVFIVPNTLISDGNMDLANQFYGWRDFGFSELKKGHLALWNPYLFCGAPFFAGFQSALLYPPNWLFMVMPLVFALNFSIVLHVFLAGFFMYLWLSRNDFHFVPSLFGALVFILGGAFISHTYFGHVSNICTFAWVPLVFLMVDGHLRVPSLKWVLGGIVAMALELLAGHVQYFVYTLFFAGLYTLTLLILDRRLWLEKSIGTLAMVGGALAVTAVQCLPGLEALNENLRMLYTELGDLQFDSLNPAFLMTLVVPGLNGNTDKFCAWADSQFSSGNTLFIGCAAFLLALYGLKETREIKRWLWLGLGLLAIICALGFYTPVYPLLHDWVPTFSSFRGTYKFCFFFQLAFAFLGALGLQEYLSNRPVKTWPVWTAFLLSAGFLIAAFDLFLSSGKGMAEVLALYRKSPLSDQSDEYKGQVSAVLMVNLMVAAAIFAAGGGLWLGARIRSSLKMGLVLLGILNLFFFAENNLAFFDTTFLEEDKAAIQNHLTPVLGDSRVSWKTHNDRSLYARIHDVWGDDPSMPRRYIYFLRYAVGTPFEEQCPEGSPLYSIPVVTPEKERLIRESYIIDESGGRLAVLKSSAPILPRALLLDRWERVKDAPDAMNRLDDPKFNPNQVVLLETTPNLLPQSGNGRGQVSMKDITTDLLEVKAETNRPEILLIGENYNLGWKIKACSDSIQQSYEVMPGDYIDRAVPLAAGSHHFYLKYEPRGFIAGIWISVISLLGFFGLGIWVFRKKY